MGQKNIGKNADIIVDFSVSEGDQLGFTRNSFDRLSIGSTPAIGYSATKKGLKKLSKIGYDFIYIDSEGLLYYDSNGADKGLGRKKIWEDWSQSFWVHLKSMEHILSSNRQTSMPGQQFHIEI